jgi:hypothetical protein
MKPFLANNSLNLSDDELINTFNNMIESPPPIVSTATTTTNNTNITDNIIICPNAINNPNQATLATTSTTPPQSILKQTDYKIKINNKQNTKSFLPYSSPIINFKNSSRKINNKANSMNGDHPHATFGNNNNNGTSVAKKEKITLIVDDTPFFLTSDLFNSYPNTYLGQ